MEWWRRGAVPVWSAVLAVLVGLPWFRGGYLLSYDMVWVPHLDLGRADVWGLGSAIPRAVPSDAVVAALGAVVDPVVVQRAILLLPLILAGVGAARLVPGLGLLPRLTAATFAIWNPYVAERLVMGHWPLLIGYAGLFWLYGAARAGRRDLLLLALLATSMTPATGVMGVVVAVVASRRWRIPIVAGLLTNAPWIVASLANRDTLAPDSSGIEAFAIQPEGPLGRIGSAFSLGGIWNTEVVPTSRGLLIATIVTALLWAVMIIGFPRAPGRRGLAALATIGLVVATIGWWAPGLMSWAVDVAGPTALLRDGTRWLALLAIAECVALAHGVDILLRRLRATPWQAAPLLVLLLPVAALPDLANGVDGRLTPVSYPPDWERARVAIADSAVPGDLLVLPFSIYRQQSWNHDRKVLDPAGRYFDRPTVTDDRLEVGSTTVDGEDPRSRAVRVALSDGADPGELADLGIGLVVVDVTAPGGASGLEAVSQLDPVLSDGDLRVFADPGAVPTAPESDAVPTAPESDAKVSAPSIARRAAVIAAWVVWGLILVGALADLIRRSVPGVRVREPRP